MATNKAGGVQGEGDYVSAKKFDDEERSFVESGRVAKKARKAAAQGKSLPKGAGAGPDQVRDERDAHTEENLDKGLEETFPASDPVSISPGAD